MTPERRLSPDRRNDITVNQTLAIQVIVWLIAALLTYGAINVRVAVVESKQVESDKRMERIENKIDRLLERVQ